MTLLQSLMSCVGQGKQTYTPGGDSRPRPIKGAALLLMSLQHIPAMGPGDECLEA